MLDGAEKRHLIRARVAWWACSRLLETVGDDGIERNTVTKRAACHAQVSISHHLRQQIPKNSFIINYCLS